MKGFDRYLQRARIARAKPFVRERDVVLDIGCADGQMFKQWQGYIGHGIGIDPSLAEPEVTAEYELIPGTFPGALPAGVQVDVITMLAVLEHIPPAQQALLADTCAGLLRAGGRIVITVPSPHVDHVLHVLERVRLIDGISLHEHYGFEPAHTPALFPGPTFALAERRSFQLGLNNLFVFTKQGGG